ncbi:C40 family peptidase [Rhodococcus sp. ARC_M6]|uniref:C40 family peptidase n=1 Tax=Rhodococcus sp. ARC_M6 TaxID=2928852 RepID=UPI001FB33F79|nr:C40 family peptidase [Rhodococcus sp. ARC_M6]MCJ0903792.1 C40 family peptidase [Rhodococcus sp. ARC_M6]
MVSSKKFSRVRTALTVSALAIGLVALPALPATADPVISNPTEALEKLGELARVSEQTNEALHNAQIDLDAKEALRLDTDTRFAADQERYDAANVRVSEVAPAVNRIATANYQGARTNRLFALMVSDSPQQLLDQMSALDVISNDAAVQVRQFNEATGDARRAAESSKQSADEARTAADQAKALSDDLQRKQSELQAQVAEVTKAFDNLTESERVQLSGTTFPPGVDSSKILANLTPGSGTAALQAGLTRIGDPYVWGATGPDEFDCSGLVVWSYKQVGKTLPRSSQAQAAGGTPISRDQLQPGDIVTFYSDNSHVGIYAGDGNILHASTFGVPVKVQSMAGMPFSTARRY